MTASLRRTVAQDLPAVVALETSADTGVWLGVTGIDWHRAALEDCSVRHYVLSLDESVAGFAVVAHSTGGSAELRRLVVDPGRRGFGLGRWLIDSVLADLRQSTDRHWVWLDVKKDNGRAQSLYRSVGFVEFDGPEQLELDPGLCYFKLTFSR